MGRLSRYKKIKRFDPFYQGPDLQPKNSRFNLDPTTKQQHIPAKLRYIQHLQGLASHNPHINNSNSIDSKRFRKFKPKEENEISTIPQNINSKRETTSMNQQNSDFPKGRLKLKVKFGSDIKEPKVKSRKKFFEKKKSKKLKKKQQLKEKLSGAYELKRSVPKFNDIADRPPKLSSLKSKKEILRKNK